MIPRLLKQRGAFRIFWAGETISLLGDQVTLLALPLVAVQQLQAGAPEMGYLTAAGWLPYLLFALPAGAWVDRRGRRRRLMIVADLGRALVVLTVLAAYVMHLLTLGQLFVVAFLAGSFSVFFSLSYQTLFVSMVPRERYPEGQSLINGSRAFSFIAGPGLGGLLVQLFTAPFALFADVVSFVLSATALTSIAPSEPPLPPKEPRHLSGGIRFILGSPLMRSALAATATLNLFNFAFSALLILFAVRDLQLQPGLIGIVLGSGAVGGLLGSMITVRLARRIGIGPAFMVGCVVFPLPLILVPLASGPRPIVLAMLFLAEFGAGLGVMILDISIGSVFAALIPDRLRARVSGAYTVVNYGIRPLGALLGGLLGAVVGVRQALLIAAVGSALGVLWLLPSPFPTLKELPEAAA